MNRARLAGTAAALAAAIFPAAAAAQKTPKVTPASAPASANATAAAPRPVISAALPVPDKGVFRILLNGTEVGTEQFSAEMNGDVRIVRSEAILHPPGQPETRSSGELRVAADGSPVAYKWTSQADKKASGSVEFKDGTAKTFLDQVSKDPYQADFTFPSSRVAVLDNNLYYQYALVAQLYDWDARGSQTLPVLIPQDVTPGAITVEYLGQKTVEGGTFETLRVTTADLEMLVYYDSRHRLMRLEAPSAQVTIVRR